MRRCNHFWELDLGWRNAPANLRKNLVGAHGRASTLPTMGLGFLQLRLGKLGINIKSLLDVYILPSLRNLRFLLKLTVQEIKLFLRSCDEIAPGRS